MQIETLKDLYIAKLHDMHDGEAQLVDALSEMAEHASDGNLKNAFSDHREETRQHKERLEQVFDGLSESASGGQCDGLAGLIKEGQTFIKNHNESEARDAGLIATAQQVEHFEIAAYGTLCTYAEMLDRKDDVSVLKETLDEEKSADSKLNDIAQKTVNPKAAA